VAPVSPDGNPLFGANGAKMPQVIALPGILSPTTELDDLRDMPVYLRLGAKDNLHWGNFYPSIVERLTRAHAKLNAKLLPSAGHGVPIHWDELDPWLSTLRPRPRPAPVPER